MSVFSVVLLAVTFFAALAVSWALLLPIFREPEDNKIDEQENQIARMTLLERKEILLQALEELEQDLAAARVTSSDYEKTKAELTRDLAQSLSQIDALTEGLPDDAHRSK